MLAVSMAMPFCRGYEHPINLTGVANADFKDEVAGDGKGGWSDQGPLNDMRVIDLARTNYGGVNFRLIDPRRNGGRAVTVFDSKYFRTGLKTATITFPQPYPAASYLYLLHSSCYNQQPKGMPVGSVEVSFADGTGIFKRIGAGTEVGDWWNPASLSNGLVVFEKWNGNNAVGLFLSKLELVSRQTRKISAITFRGTGKVVWIVAGATLSDRSVPVGLNSKKVIGAGREWKVVDTSDIQVKSGSALDLSSFLSEAPAGRHGRVIINAKGELAFADSPDTPRRFKGFNGFYSKAWADLKGVTWPEFWKNINTAGWRKQETRENISRYAGLVRRQGYDMIRAQGMEKILMIGSREDYRFNPELLDDVDWLFNEMKKQGVYIWLPLGGYGLGYGMKDPENLAKSYNASTPKHSAVAVFLGEKSALEHWKNTALAMLNHVNPYTGLAWKDDPAFIGMEFFNEQILAGILRLNPATLPDDIRELLKRKWNEWLEQKYKKMAVLGRAWKLNSDIPENFGGIVVPEKGIDGSGPAVNDFSCFMRELALLRVAWYEDIVRRAGYKGITSSGYNASKQILDSSIQWQASPLVCSNNYSGGEGMAPIGGTKVWQNSLIRQNGGYWLSTNAQRLADRPFMVTEHAFTFWNRQRHEEGMIWGAYSALQGFAAVNVHNDVVKLKAENGLGNGAMKTFPEATSPVYRANEFLVTCLYRRGDVARARHRVQLDIPNAFLYSGCNGNRAVNLRQSRIALVTGFSIAFPGLKVCPGVGKEVSRPLLTLFPDSGAVVKSTEWESSVSGSSGGGKFDMNSFCRLMRTHRIIGSDNITDPAKEIYQSDTGEILMRSKDQFMQVITARTEAVVLNRSVRAELKYLTVHSSSVPACVAVSSIDGASLDRSGRMVLVYSTNDANSGMELSADEKTMFKLGSLPILMYCGKLEVSLKHSGGGKLALYALGLNGERKQRLPLSAENGVIHIELDTATLKNGPTPFFELVRE